MLESFNASISNQLPLFFLVISLLFTALLFWVYKRSQKFQLDSVLTLNTALIIMILALFGARATHILWESPEFYKEHPAEIFNLMTGGFVYFGGALLAGSGAIFYLKFKKAPWLRYADLFAIPASLGTSLGRIGCSFAGCCYGKYCELPWAWNQRHPTQVYSLIWDLALTFLLIILENKKRLPAGHLFMFWLLGHGVGRFIIEQFRDDFRGHIFWLSFSSWISLTLIVTSGAYLLMAASSKSAVNKK